MCNGNHNLKVIFYEDAWDGTQVVRWCENCGAVVIDVDYDNRTYPGKIMKMKFPKIAYQNLEK